MRPNNNPVILFIWSVCILFAFITAVELLCLKLGIIKPRPAAVNKVDVPDIEEQVRYYEYAEATTIEDGQVTKIQVSDLAEVIGGELITDEQKLRITTHDAFETYKTNKAR